jgi:hypothetical protein
MLINFVAAPTKKQDGKRYRRGRTSDSNDTLTKIKKNSHHPFCSSSCDDVSTLFKKKWYSVCKPKDVYTLNETEITI